MTFTLADLIGYAINPVILKIFALLLMSVTVGFVIRKLFLYYHSLTALESLGKNSQPLCKKLRNSDLYSCIRKYEIKILTCPTLNGSPFVAGLISSIIYIPRFQICLLLQVCEIFKKHPNHVFAHHLTKHCNPKTRKYSFTTSIYPIQKNSSYLFLLSFWNCFLDDFFREVLDVLRPFIKSV